MAQQNLQQFGQTIKQKYPQYNDIPDAELGQKMLTKYPQYKDMVSVTPPQQPGSQDLFGSPTLGKISNFGNKIAETGFNLEKGFVKGAASTIATVPTSVGAVVGGVSDLGTQQKYNESIQGIADSNNKLLDLMKTLPAGDPRRSKYMKIIKSNEDMIGQFMNESKSATDQAQAFAQKPEFVKPKGTAENIGYGAEKVGEFIYSSNKIARPVDKALASNPVPQFLQATKVATPFITKALTSAARIGTASLAEGGASGITTAAQGGSIKDITKSAILTSIFSVPFKAINEFAPAVSSYLKTSAEKKAAQALGPTGKADKALTDKVVPSLLDRKFTFITRAGGLAKADANVDSVGEKIGDAWDALPPDTRISISPVMKQLEDAKDALTVSGSPGVSSIPISAQPKYEAIQAIQNDILSYAKEDPNITKVLVQAYTPMDNVRKIVSDSTPEELQAVGGLPKAIEGAKQDIIARLETAGFPKYAQKLSNLDLSGVQNVDEAQNLISETLHDTSESVSADSLRKYKQITDEVIAGKKGGFGLTGNEGAQLTAQKEGANAIRNALNSDNPDIAKLNKEYNFWKNVQTVLGNTVQRTKAQGTPLGETIAEGAGAVTGAVTKGTLGSALLTATGLKLLKSVVTSPAWRMTSGIVRDQIADNIANGNVQNVMKILNGIIAGTVSGPSQK